MEFLKLGCHTAAMRTLHVHGEFIAYAQSAWQLVIWQCKHNCPQKWGLCLLAEAPSQQEGFHSATSAVSTHTECY